MAKVLTSSELLEAELNKDADEFSQALTSLAVMIDADLSLAIRKGVFDTFRSIIRRSPVLTGAYRASHGIANIEPAGDEEVVKGKKGVSIPASVAIAKGANWTWKLGDGDIYIFNNLPYSERIENGWSGQAGDGVYRVALPEMTQFLNKELEKVRSAVLSWSDEK